MSLGVNGSLNGYKPQSIPALLEDISKASVDVARSNAWKAAYTAGGADHLKADTTIPYQIVDAMPTVALGKVLYSDESDIVPLPLSPSTQTENGIMGMPGALSADFDHHSLILNRSNCVLYETYQTRLSKGVWSADSLTLWDMTRPEHRPYGFTSADVAGLSVFIPLLRYDEVAAGSITHALRMTFSNTSRYVVAPATHAGGSNDTQTALLGARLRLRADYPEDGLSPANLTILHALKRYGAVIADNGSNMYITGTLDARWDQDDLQNLSGITENDFDMVQTGTVLDSSNFPTGQAPTIGSFTYTVAGGKTILKWSIQNDSYDYVQESGLVTGLSTLTQPYIPGQTYTLVSNNQYGRTVAKLTVQ